jgi:hypothetical protein
VGGGWDVRGEDDGLRYPCAAEVSLRIEIGRMSLICRYVYSALLQDAN